MKYVLKNKISITLILVLGLISFFSFNTTSDNSTHVIMETSSGKMVIKLYDETPIHRDNFLKLVKSEFYKGVTFHRVIKDFMAQAGDPNSRNPEFSGALGQNSEGKTLPAVAILEEKNK